jgi:hypothetical protein
MNNASNAALSVSAAGGTCNSAFLSVDRSLSACRPMPHGKHAPNTRPPTIGHAAGDRGFELLRHCTALTELQLSRCGLEALPPPLLPLLGAQLYRLDLSYNPLLEMDPGLGAVADVVGVPSRAVAAAAASSSGSDAGATASAHGIAASPAGLQSQPAAGQPQGPPSQRLPAAAPPPQRGHAVVNLAGTRAAATATTALYAATDNALH